MKSAQAKIPTEERERHVTSGWLMLPIAIALYAAGPVLIYFAVVNGTTNAAGKTQPDWWLFAGGIVAILIAALLSPGFFALQPNEARVLILFGDYRGTAKQGGFCWGNPFYSNGPATQSTGQSIWTKGKATSGDGIEPVAAQEAQALQDQPARPHAERREAQGQRQARQPHRDRRRRGLARRGHGPGGVRRRRLTRSTSQRRARSAVRHLASTYAYDHGESDDTRTRSRCAAASTRSREALRVELTERLEPRRASRGSRPA